MVVVTFTVIKTKEFGWRQFPQFSKNTVYRNLDDYGVLNAEDIGFEFAFAFYDIRRRVYKAPDPRMVTVGVRRVDMTMGEKIDF